MLSLLAPGDWLAETLEGSWSSSLMEVLAENTPVIVDSEQGIWIKSQLRPESGIKLPTGTLAPPTGPVVR